jgi:hypothetical protein
MSQFGEESECEIVKKWKRKVYDMYGMGGIKKRVLELIKEDLKNE